MRRLLTTTLLLTALTTPASAQDGTLKLHSCRNADGTGGAAAGWQQSKLGDHAVTRIGAAASCSIGRGPLAALQPENHIAVPSGDFARVQYSAPSGLTISGLRLTRELLGIGRDAARSNSEWFRYELIAGADFPLESCGGTAGTCANLDNTRAQNSTGTTQAFSVPDNTSVTARVIQGHVSSSALIPWPDSPPTLTLTGAVFTLADAVAPTVSGVSGGLASDTSLSGTETATFSANDASSGVYRATVRVNGAVVKRVFSEDEPSSCRPAAGGASDYEFNGGGRPCPASVTGRSISLDTSTLPEGTITLTVEVEDASGRTTPVVAARQVTIDNVPAPSNTTRPAISGIPQVGSQLTTTNGQWETYGLETAYSVFWFSCDSAGADCRQVGTGPTYSPATAEAGRSIFSEVRATSLEGTTASRSSGTGAVQPASTTTTSNTTTATTTTTTTPTTTATTTATTTPTTTSTSTTTPTTTTTTTAASTTPTTTATTTGTTTPATTATTTATTTPATTTTATTTANAAPTTTSTTTSTTATTTPTSTGTTTSTSTPTTTASTIATTPASTTTGSSTSTTTTATSTTTATTTNISGNTTTTPVAGAVPPAGATPDGKDACAQGPRILISNGSGGIRSFAASATTVRGRVVSTTGVPVGGAVLELTQSVRRLGSYRVTPLRTVTTRPDGTFAAPAGRGPSRGLQLTLLACGVRSLPVQQKVRAQIRFRTSTPRVRNLATARFSGQVLGGYHGGGTALQLQARVGRRWQDVRPVRTDGLGRFRTSYRFTRTYVRYAYRFRVVTRAGGAYPFLANGSPTATVLVNPHLVRRRSFRRPGTD